MIHSQHVKQSCCLPSRAPPQGLLAETDVLQCSVFFRNDNCDWERSPSPTASARRCAVGHRRQRPQLLVKSLFLIKSAPICLKMSVFSRRRHPVKHRYERNHALNWRIRPSGDHDGQRAAHHILHRRYREHRGADGQAPHAPIGLTGLHRNNAGGSGGQEAVQDDLPRLWVWGRKCANFLQLKDDFGSLDSFENVFSNLDIFEAHRYQRSSRVLIISC